jgi:putative ABC transport system permease protein
VRRFLERVLNLIRVRRPDRDLTREIDSHLALLQETYEARGLSADEARRAARLAFGSVAHAKDLHRDARSFRWIEDARQDALHGLRLLRRSPVFAATAVLSLAVGIGANTAIFTVANALLFRPPTGIADPSGLVVIGTARGDGGLNPLAQATYLDISHRTTALTSVFAEEMFPHVMGLARPGTDNAVAVLGRYVTSSFFNALGSSPFRGRVFADGDEAAAVLDYDYWKRRLNSDDTTIGQVLRLNGRPVTIVGVAAPDFQGTGIQKCDVWLAIGSGESSSRSLMAGGRMRPGVSLDTAVAELRAIGEAINRDQSTPGDQGRRLSALPFSRTGGNRNIVRGFAAALMVLVSLVLAAACANVAGIMLTRATARAREIALRAALGAGRGRLVRQFLTETTVLFLLGGLVGLGLARVLTSLAMTMLPPLPASIAVPLVLDWRVMIFALSLSLSAAIAFGVMPALRGSRVQPGSSLKDGARSSSGQSRLRSAFVVGQIACGVLLVVLAASFVRVLRHAGAADPGFDAPGVDIATLDASVTGEPRARPAEFWSVVIDRVRQISAVERASLARVPPGGFEGIGLGGVAPADRPGTTDVFTPAWNIVDAGYFATLHIPIVAGRDFAPSDTSAAPRIVIVSERLARRFWPGQSAIGKPLRLDVFNARSQRPEPLVSTVVGVAGDIRSSSLIDGLAEPCVYLPLAQSDAVGVDMTTQMSIVARRRGEASLAATIATVVQNIDQRLVLTRTESLAESIAFGLTPQHLLATISGAMGLVALLLAAMGIYGVTAYTVALRRREFAIRLALGAPRTRVIRMVFSQGTWLVAIGLGAGLALAIGAGQVLSVFFYGLPAAHVPTLLGTVALFLAVGAAASVVPAAQAVRGGWRRALQED